MIKKNAPYITACLILLSLAWIYTPELKTDALTHYLNSVGVVRRLSFYDFFTDVWDKPIPILLYGIPGQLGLFFARASAVIITIATIYFLKHLSEKLLDQKVDGWEAVILYLSILTVFGQSFLTMTELPAAFFLAWGLYEFYVKGRLWSAYLLFGFMPLCRIESLYILFGFGFLLAINKEISIRVRILCLTNLFLPFTFWYLGGAFMTNDLVWLSARSYLHLRPLDFSFFYHNALTALPMVLNPIGLFFFVLGAYNISIKEIKKYHLIYVGLIIQLIFLSSSIPYPIGENNWTKLISAWNDRNFNVVSPLFYILIIYGISKYHLDYKRSLIPMYFIGILVFAVNLICYFTFPLHYSWISIALSSLLVIVPILKRIGTKIILLLFLTTFLLFKGDFWNPTKYNDPDIVVQKPLWDFLNENYQAGNFYILQDLCGSMKYFIDNKNINSDWTWANEFPEKIKKLDKNSMVLIETVPGSYLPSVRYPRETERLLTEGQLKEVIRSDGATPYGWILYIKK
jgi:hypothetical protein